MARTLLRLTACASLILASSGAPTEPDRSMNLPVLYRVDQPTSNVVVFRGAQVAQARRAGLLGPQTLTSVTTPKGARARPFQAANPTPVLADPTNGWARGNIPLPHTLPSTLSKSEARGHRKLDDDEYRHRYENVRVGKKQNINVKSKSKYSPFRRKHSTTGSTLSRIVTTTSATRRLATGMTQRVSTTSCSPTEGSRL